MLEYRTDRVEVRMDGEDKLMHGIESTVSVRTRNGEYLI